MIGIRRHMVGLATLASLLLGADCVVLLAQSGIELLDVTKRSGITFQHSDGSYGKRQIIETVASGIATFDYDLDGDLDIYFLSGASASQSAVSVSATNRLYRNDGAWRFCDVTDRAGVGDSGHGLGAAIADFDNDGYPDIYLANFGENILFRNHGDGTFTNISDEAHVGGGHKLSAGVSFLDADADGDLDLYVANYVRFTDGMLPPLFIDGFARYRSPKDFEPEPDMYFRNNGDGSFSDATVEAGLGGYAGTGMGTICFDFDEDGDNDIVVLNDVRPNYLFSNDGTGRFEEVGLLSGTAYSLDGKALGSMGVDCGDYDNDGHLDLFQTSFSQELPLLLRNTGGGLFDDVTRTTGVGHQLFPHVNWGTCFADFDNDQWLDLFVANGHLQDNVELYDDTTSYRTPNSVLRNNGDGSFSDVSRQAGAGLLTFGSSRGAACEDFDGDGRVDVVVLNSRETPTLLCNASKSTCRWLKLRLVAIEGNRDSVGSCVSIRTGDLTQTRCVHSGRGYQGHWGSQLHFGLAQFSSVDEVSVTWPSGRNEVFFNVPVERNVKIVEGRGLFELTK